MAFAGGFTLAQSDESTITLTDTSTGADANITSRWIYLIKYDTTTLVPSDNPEDQTYIDWPIADLIGDTITIDILDKDYAISVEVVWNNLIDPDPDGTYTADQLYDFVFYNMLSAADLISEGFARNPELRNEDSFYNNFMKFYALIVQSRVAVGLMNDIGKAQFCLEQGTFIRENQQF